MQVGDTIRLQGRTWRGRNVVYRRGAYWTIVMMRVDRFLLVAEDGKGDVHWVRINGDLNFNVN
jgi:hypothetical protein